MIALTTIEKLAWLRKKQGWFTRYAQTLVDAGTISVGRQELEEKHWEEIIKDYETRLEGEQ